MQLIPDPRQPTDTLKCVHHYWDDGVVCFYCENKWLKHQQIESVKTYFDFAKGWKFCEALLFLVHLRLHMQMTGFRLCNSFKLMKLCSISVSAASPPSFSRASFLAGHRPERVLSTALHPSFCSLRAMSGSLWTVGVHCPCQDEASVLQDSHFMEPQMLFVIAAVCVSPACCCWLTALLLLLP